MRFLEQKVLSEREAEDRSSAVLSSFVQERMMEPVSQTHLAQVSRRIIRVVSQLLLHLQPQDEYRELASESGEEPQSAGSR